MTVVLPSPHTVIQWQGFPTYLWADCGKAIVAYGCCDLEFPNEHALKAHVRTDGVHAPIRLCSHGCEALRPKESREPGEESS